MSILARYSFLPWVRQGIANDIDSIGETHASITVDLSITTNEDGVSDSVSNKIQLVGPGDIIGLSRTEIIRTEPKNWTTDHEPNYFPFVELYNPDMAWRYSPVRNGGARMAPWLALVVLKETEFEDDTPVGAPLPGISVTLPGDKFPDWDQLWSWAHVHVNKDITPDAPDEGDVGKAVDKLEDTLDTNPDDAFCRILCPRELEANTAYHAFLIPTFEKGCLAGLGQPIAGGSADDPAWGPDSSGREQFPVYYRWYFRTGEAADFEYLVRLLEPKVMDKEVGIRDMDVTDPGQGLAGPSDLPVEAPGVLGLEGALRAPTTESTAWPGADPDPFQTELRAFLNLAKSYQDEEPDGDPVITPPIYGKWHAEVEALEEIALTEDFDWVDDLNLDPRNRTAAGFGTSVIQENQEEYMNEAWEQIGDVLEANQQIRRSQLGMESSYKLYMKSIVPLETDAVLAVTYPVSRKVIGDGATVFANIRDSALPKAYLDPAFRKIVRPRGPVMKRVDPEGDRKPADILTRVNEGEITATPPKDTPEGALTLNESGEFFSADNIPDWLKNLLGKAWFRWLPLVLAFLLTVLYVFLIVPNDIADAEPGTRLMIGLALLILLMLFLFFFIRRLWIRCRADDAIDEASLTVEAVEAVPGRSRFEIVDPGVRVGNIGIFGADNEVAANFRQALIDLHSLFEFEAAIEPEVKQQLDLVATAQTLVEAINPLVTVPKRTLSYLGLPPVMLDQVGDYIKPVMAYPIFKDPMYEPLRDLSADLLIPNVHLITENTISLLETNPTFIESYMVGLNHEMGRELLWREYPTDQRGSYFRQFWDVSEYVDEEGKSEEALEEELRDIPEIHTWPTDSDLGMHPNPEDDDAGPQMVLVIKGQLLKKYPNTVIFAQQAKREDGARTLDDDGLIKYPVFRATIEPDVTFFGFDLEEPEVRGDDGTEGYFFCLQERPGEPRFGLDIDSGEIGDRIDSWDDLHWGHIVPNNGHVDAEDLSRTLTVVDPGDVDWGENSARNAHITYQDPVLIAIHASDMLPES